MILSLQEVEHIAELAKLALTDEEKARYREQLSAILDYAARLNEYDTDEIPPTATVLPVHTVLRDDQVRDSLPRDVIIQNGPQIEDGMFVIDAVWEEGE